MQAVKDTDYLIAKAGFPASGVIPPAPPPRRAGVEHAPQAAGPAAGIAWGGAPGWAGPFPWFAYPTSSRQTLHRSHAAAPELASLLDRSSAGELIPELARGGLQQLIELEVAAVLGADRHERSESEAAAATATGPAVSPPRWEISSC